LFNTESSPEQKTLALQRFIKINEELQNSKIVAPWTVYHNDMYNQLNNLGLIKKATINVDENGEETYELSNFDDSELNTNTEEGITVKQKLQSIIESYFKLFNINPLNAESVIEKLNTQITLENKEVLNQISNIQKKGILSEEDLNKIEELKSKLYNFKIGNINETPRIKELLEISNLKITNKLGELGITMDEYNKYLFNKSNENVFSKTFEELLSKFETKD